MRIAIISPGIFSVPPVIGTSVEHDIQMVAEQLQTDHQVIVYTKKCPEYRNSERVGNLYYKRFKFLGAGKYLRRVINHLKKVKPDLIMVENRPAYVGPLKEELLGVPIFLNMHSTMYAKRPYMSTADLEQIIHATAGIITNSASLKDYFVKQIPAASDKIHSVHLGIDPSPYEAAALHEEKVGELRKKLNIGENDQVLLFIGRLLKKKGPHLLLDIFPELAAKQPDLKLILTGSPKYGSNKETSYVQRLKEKASLFPKHIIFTNFIRPEDIPVIYQLADLVIIPSIWNEPFGRVNLESMASKRAIIASDRGGMVELIKHGENGWLFSIDHYKEELPQAILDLLESREQRERYGRRGYEMVKTFTWEKTAREYVEIFNQVMGEPYGKRSGCLA